MIKFRNTSNGKTIQILTSIGKGFFEDGFTLQNIKQAIGDFDGAITLEINSPGGDAIEGLAIHDYLSSLSNTITAVIIGQCSSAATLIACAATKITATPHARWLAHRVTSFTEGNSENLASMVATLQSMDNQIAAIYAVKTGKSEDEMHALMKKDTYLTAQDALELGFIDEIVNIQKQRAMKDKLFANLTEEEEKEMAALKAENDKLKEELKNIKAKMQNMEEDEKEKVAKAEVTAAIEAGKFNAEKEADLVAIAKKDLPTFRAMAAAITVQPKKPVEPTKIEPVQNAGMTYDKWLENFKSNKYVNNIDKCRMDYKLATGKELN
jgi:ATP-dependent Clp protease, protease subunit